MGDVYRSQMQRAAVELLNLEETKLVAWGDVQRVCLMRQWEVLASL